MIVKLVAENDAATLLRKEHERRVEFALRELAANILRVIRGAGKPYEIGIQASNVVQELIAYRDASKGVFPASWDIASWLALRQDDLRLEDSKQAAFAYAQQQVIRGALQVAASQLLDQKTIEASGRHEMLGGVTAVEEARERFRQSAVDLPSRRTGPARRKPKGGKSAR